MPQALIKFSSFFTRVLIGCGRFKEAGALFNFSKIKEYSFFLHAGVLKKLALYLIFRKLRNVVFLDAGLRRKQVTFALNFLKIQQKSFK